MLIPIQAINFVTDIYDNLISKKKQYSSNDLIKYLSDNPDKIFLGISVVAGLLRASQSLVVSHRNWSNRRYSERAYYDPHTHTKWSLRRKLTNQEKKNLISRTAAGESAIDILEEMRVLK